MKIENIGLVLGMKPITDHNFGKYKSSNSEITDRTTIKEIVGIIKDDILDHSPSMNLGFIPDAKVRLSIYKGENLEDVFYICNNNFILFESNYYLIENSVLVQLCNTDLSNKIKLICFGSSN